MNWSGKRVFVTGHTGFKGSWLTFALSELGATVRGYANAPLPGSSIFNALELSSKVESQIADIRSLDTLLRAVHEFQPEVIFHLAAQPLVRYSYREPIETFATNAVGTANLLEAARRTRSIKAIIVITTDKVYFNRESDEGYREEDRLGGSDPYSASKACAELITASYRQSFLSDVPVITVRAGNIIGGGDWSEDRLVPDAVRAFVAGEALTIRNPQSVRPWQHVLEPVRGYLMLAEKMQQAGGRDVQALNFGPARSDCLTVGDVIERFTRLWGREARWQHIPQQDAPKETKLLALNCELAHKFLGWTPAVSLEDALRMTVDWYQAFYRAKKSSDIRKISRDQLTQAKIM